MGDSSGSMFYGVIGFLVVYFVGYFICRVYDKIKKILRSHSSKSQRREDDNVRMLRWKLRFLRQRWECWCAWRRSFQESGYSGDPVQDHADRGYALCKLQEIR